ncbi:uncharacterized protein E0L32_000045 [Thyridium curvatum]|uniref:LIM zinc-binding domain-containing protein n=1 Tax=Thyridium curvatum TaxID=1093900 RepID=A0A507BFH1_9PEZI|nr:uncharacterized protein E0L32_000045 [Thyridium curvatum]TPX15711.1 hypothetical protein E0L32_000045 [Thyridium curvatum]
MRPSLYLRDTSRITSPGTPVPRRSPFSPTFWALGDLGLCIVHSSLRSVFTLRVSVPQYGSKHLIPGPAPSVAPFTLFPSLNCIFLHDLSRAQYPLLLRLVLDDCFPLSDCPTKPVVTNTESAASAPSSDSLDAFMPFNKSVHEKIGRVPPPPSVDTKAASMSTGLDVPTERGANERTDRSYYRAGQLTPHSLSSGSRSVSPQTPVGRPGGARNDDYAAPRIADDYDPAVQQPRRPGGYGEFDEPNGYGAEPMYPASPKLGGPDLLQRMNSIAPGPFEMKRRAEARAARGSNAGASEEGGNGPVRAPFPDERPGTSASMRSNGMPPPRMPRKDGYGGFGPPERPQDEFEPRPFGGQRAGTFPRPSDPTEQPPARAPSAPGPRPDRLRSSSSISDEPPLPTDRLRRPSAGMGADTSRPPPPRTSVVRPRTAGRDGGSVPAINLAEEFGIGNPYHTPSESMSSSTSSVSRPTNSSQSSPPRSVASDRSGRKPSDTSTFDTLMSDIQSSMDELKPSSLDRQFSSNSSSRDRYDPAVQAPQGLGRNRPRSPLASPSWDSSSPSSARNDPAVQAPSAGGGGNRQQQQQQQRSRGACKACGEAITGKSISSADGRLTGRYHKACFVCTTCRAPFASAEFYVHGDRPYCDHHYHERNGSLCGGCDGGIEGQYLADEGDKKYHPGCFRCGDCGVVLNDGYFDVSGRAYCEKDAWRRVQQPWLSGGGGGGGAGPGPGPGPGRGMPPPPGRRMSPAPGGPRGPGMGMGMGGLPSRPGLPMGNRLAAPMPRMEKRMTRLGMMG